MRVAVVSDIHGNRTAFEAVLADLKQISPDVVFHGGDLADSGSGAIEVVDQIRDLGWKGVVGNTDQMLAVPETFESFASQSPQLIDLWRVIREMAADSRELLGETRLAWHPRSSAAAFPRFDDDRPCKPRGYLVRAFHSSQR